MDLNPICHPSPAKKWNVHFWITFNFWWSAGLVNGLEPHPAPLSSHKNEMLVFGLCSTSDDLPGWSMDSNPICHPSPAKKMKCSFLNYVQLLMIGWAIQAKNVNRNAKKWKRPPKSSKNKMFIFGLHSTSDDWPRDLSKKAKNAKKSTSKNKMFIFGLCSTPDDWRSWSMDSNPVCHPSPAKKMKCLFLDYVQWRLVDGKSVSSQKNEMLVFGLCSTSDDQPSDPSKKFQPKCKKTKKTP